MALTEQYKHYLEMHGYLHVQEIPGRGICALCKYMYTVGIVWGLDDTGYKGRWCYSGLVQAAVALASWDGQGDPPLEWIKYKGEDGERTRATEEQTNPKIP